MLENNFIVVLIGCSFVTSGGSGSEAGGPGVTYFKAGEYSNLRVDNKCQLPEITLPSSYYAAQSDYDAMLETGDVSTSISHTSTNLVRQKHNVILLLL